MSEKNVPNAVKAALGTPEPGVEPATKPAPAPSSGAHTAGIILLFVGFLLAIIFHGVGSRFEPRQGFVLFTGFYVATQAVERFLEIVLPPGDGTAKAKADRVVIVGGLGLLLGVILSLTLGLRFLSAVQVGSPPRWLDTFTTGLVIAGGTKPLHDLIGAIQKAKT